MKSNLHQAPNTQVVFLLYRQIIVPLTEKLYSVIAWLNMQCELGPRHMDNLHFCIICFVYACITLCICSCNIFFSYFFQDTIVGLQALSDFARMVYSSNFDIQATITAGTFTHTFSINQMNALVLQSVVVI